MSLPNAAQLAIEQSAKEFVAQNIIPHAAAFDKSGEFHAYLLNAARPPGDQRERALGVGGSAPLARMFRDIAGLTLMDAPADFPDKRIAESLAT